MSHEAIETYIAEALKQQLYSLNIPSNQIESIANSVREQMVSCIYHWNDVDFRSAILITGEEEGAFYLPKAEVDVQNFVVATVRNSPLESIHADSYHPSGQERRLTPDDIKALTSAAIGHFSKVDFPKIAEEISAPENDRYGDLAQRYPVSWEALASLAYTTSSEPIVEYEPIQLDNLPNLNNLKQRHAVGGMFFKEDKSQFMQVTDDGYC